MKIDAHQHFWIFDPARDSWITDEMKMIKRDFLPADLHPLLSEAGFDGCVVVQSNQTEAENDFQLENAKKYDFIKGVVGWVDLKAGNLEEKLAQYTQFEKLKGFRHVLQGEADRAFMLSEQFIKGISRLNDYGYTYDILIHNDQLPYVIPFVKAFPDQPFVIDHIAKPAIKDQEIKEWKKQMTEIAGYQNVYCKVSGMVTEADWQHWKYEDFVPYIDTVVNAFGTRRVMYGSDWPVCLVAGSYQKILGIVEQYFSSFSEQEKTLFFGENAVGFYQL